MFNYHESISIVNVSGKASSVPVVADLIALDTIGGPQVGWVRWVVSESALFAYNGSAWEELDTAIDAGTY